MKLQQFKYTPRYIVDFLNELNQKLMEAGMLQLNKEGAKFIANLIDLPTEERHHCIEPPPYPGVYLNIPNYPIGKTDKYWSVEDDSSNQFQLHVASSIICVYGVKFNMNIELKP